MIDIDEIVRLLEKRPLDTLIYSADEDRFLNEEETRGFDLSLDEDGFCYFYGSSTCYKVARIVFRGKHRDIFPKAPSSYSYKKWFETIEKEHLEKEWFHELRQALAENVTEFVKHYGLREIETPRHFYDDIKKELMIFEKAHYEKRYCDMVLFHLRTHYEIVPFTILGNAGNVFGISFYPSDDEGTCFMRTQTNDILHIDQGTLSALSNMLSFYFEKDKGENFGVPYNPFGKDNRYTSLYMTNGSFMRMYLPKSVAIRALDFLKTANLLTPLFDKTRGKEIIMERFYDVYLDIDRKTSMIFDKDMEEDSRIVLIPEINPSYFPEERYTYVSKGEWDVTIRALPNYFYEKDGSPNCGHFGFICLICDHKTGRILINEMGEAADFRLFDDLVLHMAKKLKGMLIPKKLYVDTYLDFVFFQTFFGLDYDKGEVDIIPSATYLATDDAYDKMVNFLSKAEENGFEDDFSEEKVYKS